MGRKEVDDNRNKRYGKQQRYRAGYRWVHEGEHELGNRKIKKEKQEMRSSYTVESPTESPERERAIIIHTGLSPLIKKVNLKRKYEEEIEYDSEELAQARQKKYKKGLIT